MAISKTAKKTANKGGLIRLGIRKLISILRQKDPPHRIALGAAIGIFIGLLPIMGIQMAVATILALPLRGNIKAAIAGVWISNPITFIPMYFGYYQFGLVFFPTREIGWDRFKEIVTEAAKWDWSAVGHSIAKVLSLGADILIPMWTGSGILAVVFGIVTYFVAYRFVVNYRARKKNTSRSQP